MVHSKRAIFSEDKKNKKIQYLEYRTIMYASGIAGMDVSAYRCLALKVL